MSPTTTASPSSTLLPSLFGVAASESELSLQQLGSVGLGLTSPEARRRLDTYGPNAVRIRRTRAWLVLGRQLRSPLLLLLAVTATASYFVGEHTDAVIIGVIVAAVGRARLRQRVPGGEGRRGAALADQPQLPWRGGTGRPLRIDVTALVPGDVVELELGEIVPADLRLLTVDGLECDESVLTGESLPVEKAADAGGRGERRWPT